MPTNDITYDEAERRVCLDFAARVLADPHASDDHVARARERLMAARLDERDLEGWLRAQPSGLLRAMRDLLDKHREATPAGE